MLDGTASFVPPRILLWALDGEATCTWAPTELMEHATLRHRAAWHAAYGNVATLHFAHALVSQQRTIEAGRARGPRGGIGLELRRSARVVSAGHILPRRQHGHVQCEEGRHRLGYCLHAGGARRDIQLRDALQCAKRSRAPRARESRARVQYAPL